ncbi:P-loop containing nucleoside triphosphate hydrolase protein [Melampsora americana]|nr:P-loop containing nucleoside triphosphate hydrolase protein [Melampsora americana]
MEHAFHTLTKAIHFKRPPKTNHETRTAQVQTIQKTSDGSYPSQLDVFSNSSSKKTEERLLVDSAKDNELHNDSIEVANISSDEVSLLRKRHKIRLTPTILEDPSIPDLITSFDQLTQFTKNPSKSRKPRVQLPADTVHNLVRNMSLRGWNQPTPIQMQAIPIILAGRDLLAHSPTGSGKTIAFLLPILLSLPPSNRTQRKPRALFIEPTRELAQQICEVTKGLMGAEDESSEKKWIVSVLGEGEPRAEDAAATAQKPRKRQRKTSNGTADRKPSQANVISRLPTTGCDVLISTPLKLLYHIRDSPESLSDITHLVLDEVDQLLDKSSFLEQVDQILEILKQATTSNQDIKVVQKVMMSATISSEVEELSKSVMSSARFVRLLIGQKHAAPNKVKQRLDYVDSEASKLSHFVTLLRNNNNTLSKVEKLCPPVLIFCQSAERVEELCKILRRELIGTVKPNCIDYIHGSRPKEERDRIVLGFANKSIWFLCCTDIFSRGIDFKEVNTVICWDFPQSSDSYLHRIGRTGRADNTGQAVTFFTKQDGKYLKMVVNVMKNSGCEVPDWMLKLGNLSKNDRKLMKVKPLKRTSVKQAALGINNANRKRKKDGELEKDKVDGDNEDDEEEWVPCSVDVE